MQSSHTILNIDQRSQVHYRLQFLEHVAAIHSQGMARRWRDRHAQSIRIKPVEPSSGRKAANCMLRILRRDDKERLGNRRSRRRWKYGVLPRFRSRALRVFGGRAIHFIVSTICEKRTAMRPALRR
jgi:hypothetical protein